VTRPRRLGALALGGTLFLGCGPVEYLNQVTNRAGTALAQAQRDSADQLAPYEYRMAAEYHHKAREEAGYASFQVAIDYGRKAEAWAAKARSLALERAAKDDASAAVGAVGAPNRKAP
jgi:hypothetical protein